MADSQEAARNRSTSHAVSARLGPEQYRNVSARLRLPKEAQRSSTTMARKAGTADLPLHGGHVPKWLADRMTRLGTVISEAIVHHYGRDELLRRLAHPFWFQSFGAVMGMTGIPRASPPA